MPLFLDTGDRKEIVKYLKLGVIRGVTTNPTILRQAGFRGGEEKLGKLQRELAGLLSPLPLSVEVTTNKKSEMISQARRMAEWGENINVKIPVHGPKGELFNLEVINQLEHRYDIRVNATAIMSAQQGLLAALAGATYISIFGGRVNNMGYNCIKEISCLRRLLDQHAPGSQIIVGSTREVLNIVEWLDAGAQIVTVTPKLIAGMATHPYTRETVAMFLNDASRK